MKSPSDEARYCLRNLPKKKAALGELWGRSEASSAGVGFRLQSAGLGVEGPCRATNLDCKPQADRDH